MMEKGGLLDARTQPLRAILFAGEPFPIKHLRRLRRAFPAQVRLLNLYGPTETNVCTFHEVHGISDERSESVPIGRACSGDRVWAERDDGSPAEPGQRGELVVDGPTVMNGYWGRTPHRGPYRTGDIVDHIEPGAYAYVGRRDSMVKVRGYRVGFATFVDGKALSVLDAKRHCAELLPRYMIVDDLRPMPSLPLTRNGKVDRRALSNIALPGSRKVVASL
jgi:clorobiocin biosynthesis protein CloN4